MLALKTLFVLLFTSALAFRIPRKKPCEYTYSAYPGIKTPERCADKCSSCTRVIRHQFAYSVLCRSDRGGKGDCFAWTISLHDVRICYLHFVKFGTVHRDGNNCDVNPVPSMNELKVIGLDEAPGSELSITGCYISTGTIDLGSAPTKYSCELLCLGHKTEQYSACLLWFYDEYRASCRGILVEDSVDKACGIPSTMPL